MESEEEASVVDKAFAFVREADSLNIAQRFSAGNGQKLILKPA
jgi:hypothetical protein